MKKSQIFSSLLCLAGLALLFALAPITGLAQSAGNSANAYSPGVRINLWFDPYGNLEVGVVDHRVELPGVQLVHALSLALHGSLILLPVKGNYDLIARVQTRWLRTGGIVSGAFNPTALFPLLKAQGAVWLAVAIDWHGIPQVTCLDAIRYPSHYKDVIFYWERYHVNAQAPAAAIITFSYGYGAAAVPEMVLTFSLYFLLPLLLTYLMVRSSLSKYRKDSKQRKVIWFRFTYFLHWAILGAWLLWIFVFISENAFVKIEFLLHSSSFGMIGTHLLLYLLPFLDNILMAGIAYPVFTEIGGKRWTRSELMVQAAWSKSLLLPVICLINAFDEYYLSPHLTVIWILAAMAAYQLARYGAFRAQGTYPVPISSGELRDRIVELAAKAGVRLKQSYLLPAGKGNIANAFAMYGNRMGLTQTLIEHLTPAEVDAVIGHELTHLRRRHPAALLLISFSCWVSALVSVYYLLIQIQEKWIAALAYPGVIVLGLFLTYCLCRRFEYAADAGAVAITDDPAAGISGLARISTINLHPLAWSKAMAPWLTHPPTIERMIALSKYSPKSAEELQPWLEDEAAPSGEDRYPLPPSFSAEIFSPLTKANYVWLISWIPLVMTATAAALLMRELLLLPLSSSARILASLVALAAIILLRYFVSLASTHLFIRSLKARFFKNTQRYVGPDIPSDGFTAMLAFGRSARIYEGFYDWDIGAVNFTNEGVSYQGELCCFKLLPEQVQSIELRSLRVFASKRIYITWVSSVGEHDTFSFALYNRNQTKQLYHRLMTWWKDASNNSHSATAPSLPPQTESVSALRPRALLTIPVLLSLSLQEGLIALGIAYLFSLSLQFKPLGSAWLVVIAVVLSRLLPLFALLLASQK